ncbi:hypothetical protein OJE16_05240 [Pantoea tagorei]
MALGGLHSLQRGGEGRLLLLDLRLHLPPRCGNVAIAEQRLPRCAQLRQRRLALRALLAQCVEPLSFALYALLQAAALRLGARQLRLQPGKLLFALIPALPALLLLLQPAVARRRVGQGEAGVRQLLMQRIAALPPVTLLLFQTLRQRCRALLQVSKRLLGQLKLLLMLLQRLLMPQVLIFRLLTLTRGRLLLTKLLLQRLLCAVLLLLPGGKRGAVARIKCERQLTL